MRDIADALRNNSRTNGSRRAHGVFSYSFELENKKQNIDCAYLYIWRTVARIDVRGLTKHASFSDRMATRCTRGGLVRTFFRGNYKPEEHNRLLRDEYIIIVVLAAAANSKPHEISASRITLQPSMYTTLLLKYTRTHPKRTRPFSPRTTPSHNVVTSARRHVIRIPFLIFQTEHNIMHA